MPSCESALITGIIFLSSCSSAAQACILLVYSEFLFMGTIH